MINIKKCAGTFTKRKFAEDWKRAYLMEFSDDYVLVIPHPKKKGCFTLYITSKSKK